MVGMTTLGFVGFVGLGFNVFGALGGICVGAVLGRYAGNKYYNCSSKNIKKNVQDQW